MCSESAGEGLPVHTRTHTRKSTTNPHSRIITSQRCIIIGTKALLLLAASLHVNGLHTIRSLRPHAIRHDRVSIGLDCTSTPPSTVKALTVNQPLLDSTQQDQPYGRHAREEGSTRGCVQEARAHEEPGTTTCLRRCRAVCVAELLRLRLRGGGGQVRRDRAGGKNTMQPNKEESLTHQKVSKVEHRKVPNSPQNIRMPLKIGAFTVRDPVGAQPVMLDSPSTVFVCFDTEATGLDTQNDRIVEIAAARFTMHSGITSTFHTLINPQMHISNSDLHGITDEMVKGAPCIEDVLQDFLKFVGNATVVGHSVHFDVFIVQASASRFNQPCSLALGRHIDTFRLARHYGQCTNYSLSGVLEHFNSSVSPPDKNSSMYKSHRAMGDVLSNVEVFRGLCKPYKSLGQLFEILSVPIRLRAMPFGKHKGTRISDVPTDYLTWCMSSFWDWDEDLKHTIQDEIARRSTRPMRD